MLHQIGAFQKLGKMRVPILMMLVLLPVCRAQQPGNRGIWFDRGAKQMMRSSDVAFALNTAQVLAGEEQLASLALQRADSPAVKQFAKSLQAENRKIRKDLDAVAAKMHLVLPHNATQQAIFQRSDLLKLSGPEFDVAFLADLLTDTREGVSSYEKEARKGKEAEMKSFAARALPLLRERLDTIESLRAKQKPAGV
jgi:putative membrane protein